MTKPPTDADLARMRADAESIVTCYAAFNPEGYDPEVQVARDVLALLAEVERLRAGSMIHPMSNDIFTWIFRADPYCRLVKCQAGSSKIVFTNPGDGREYEIVDPSRTSP